MQRSELCHFSGLPETTGKHSGTMWTDVISVGFLLVIGPNALIRFEAQDNDERKPLLHPPAKSIVTHVTQD